ncbi:MAG: hypothetical protein IJR25_03105 [Bacteroidales bacterium]|nr:hypothetical protein [Bacteroidales bacterium]
MRKYGTCFFEQYAQIALATLLGEEFDCLENKDRPDLQSADGHTLGIEVTRAMDESKKAEDELLLDMAGVTACRRDRAALEEILQSGYAFGLEESGVIGIKEMLYWKMALPMQRILESKVAKVGNGFYGHFDKMGLFVFSKDDLEEVDAIKTMNYIIGLQKYQLNRYNRLYLADVNDLFVCNLDDGLQATSRLSRYPISQAQRTYFYHQALSRQE